MEKIKLLRILVLMPVLLHFFNEINAQKMIEGIHYETNKPVQVFIENGIITKIKQVKKMKNEQNKTYIAPGFIDNQVNGFAGVSFSFGESNLTTEGIEKATRELWKTGVTSYFPVLTTNSQEVLLMNFKLLANAVNDEKLLGSIPGFHLEGPYINPEDGYRGAHPKQFVRLPDWQEFEELYEAAGGKILQVTIAPEMEGAQEFIKNCSANGIVTAVGHHNANREQLDLAVENGARISTHIGNGCANLINRHYNPFWPQLSNDSLWISIICDGFHLLPEEVRVFHKTKGTAKTIITSDVTSYAALAPGNYTTQTGETIELTAVGKLHYPAQQVLYGSATPITKGVGNIIKYTGCPLSDAIQMASTNPAILYKLNDRGKLETGKRADIILFTLENENIVIQKTIVSGKNVFTKM
jgi:N-acetylglucosamine-6-phosphate deacetylase